MTKKIILKLVVSGSLLISINSCGQKSLPYLIDSTISTNVEGNIKTTLTPASSALKWTDTINDSTNAENYGLGKNFGAMTEATLSHDTIFITSFLMARKASLGYKIILTRDSCTVKYFSVEDEDALKINKTDKPSHLITLICQTKKLTLLQKPQCKVGELIEGRVELTSGDFWSVDNGVDTKVKRQLTGYFKTNLSPFLPEEKSIFKQIK